MSIYCMYCFLWNLHIHGAALHFLRRWPLPNARQTAVFGFSPLITCVLRYNYKRIQLTILEVRTEDINRKGGNLTFDGLQPNEVGHFEVQNCQPARKFD